jgi:hypothetical protein
MKGRDRLGDTDVYWRLILKCVINIKYEGVDWIAQGTVQWQAAVNLEQLGNYGTGIAQWYSAGLWVG